MSDSKIAPVGLEAIGGLLEIERQCFKNPWSISHFTSAIKSPLMNIYGYFAADLITGYIVLYRLSKVLVIANLAVSPDYRAKGIGTALLVYGLEFGRTNHCNYSILDVRQSNEKAVSLYRKEGYVIIGKNKGYYQNPYEDSFIMGRAI